VFFLLSKLFWAVARPLNFLFFLTLAALLAGRLGWRRLQRIGLVASASLFVLFGFTQFTDYLLYKLETIVPAAELPAEPAGIIILGGGLGTKSESGGVGYHLGEAADRLVKGLELHRQFPQARFIYSGGSGTLISDELPETTGAADMVKALYGDDRGMELESRSRTTYENAVEVAAMLGEEKTRPYLLVTSAFHMSRAIGCFRKAGINVIAAPTDYRAEPLQFPWIMDETPIQFLKASLLVKEFAGLLAYYVTGRTDELLPR
jgi:uncharacterized SAM-binding protein YcdF (DUF218 family)